MKLNEWKPLDEIEGRFYLKRLEDNTINLTIVLENEVADRILKLTFDSALSYRNIDEGDLLKSSQEGDHGGFFIITDSSYLKWFHRESLGIREDENICHYGIYTPNDCIDILALHPPKAEWGKSKGSDRVK